MSDFSGERSEYSEEALTSEVEQKADDQDTTEPGNGGEEKHESKNLRRELIRNVGIEKSSAKVCHYYYEQEKLLTGQERAQLVDAVVSKLFQLDQTETALRIIEIEQRADMTNNIAQLTELISAFGRELTESMRRQPDPEEHRRQREAQIEEYKVILKDRGIKI